MKKMENNLEYFRGYIAGLTQKQLSQKSKVSKDMIRRIESQGYVPNYVIASKLANSLRIEVEAIFPYKRKVIKL